MKLLPFLFLVISILSCGQRPKIPDDFDYGKTEDGVYKNGFFNMEVDIPETWAAQTKEQMDQGVNRGQKTIKKSNRELAAKVDVNRVSTAMLLQLAKKTPDPLFSPSLLVMAENISGLLSVKTAVDYLDQIKKTLKQTGMDFEVADYTTRKIGTKDFDVLKARSTNNNGRDIKSVYHVWLSKGFALAIVTVFETEEQEEELTDILQSVKFR